MPGEALVAAAAVEAVKDAAQMTAWDHMYLAKAAADVAKVKPLVVAEHALAKEAGIIAEHNKPADLLHKVEHALGDLLHSHATTPVVAPETQAPAPEQAAAPQAGSPEQTQSSGAPAPHPQESWITAIELHAASLEGQLADTLKGFAAKVRSGEQSFTDEVKAELEKIGVKF